MKRLVLALGLVATVGACQRAEEQPAQQPAADTMMADSAAADTTAADTMMAGDTGRRM